MGNVAFLTVRQRARGTVKATGPVTGIKYSIQPIGTPVSALDVPGLLEMEGDPCCGRPPLPGGKKVKLFGLASATAKQMANVPDSLWDAEPLEKVKPKRSYKKRSKEEDVVEEPVDEPEVTEDVPWFGDSVEMDSQEVVQEEEPLEE